MPTDPVHAQTAPSARLAAPAPGAGSAAPARTGEPLEPIRGDPNPGLSRLLLHGFYDLVWLLVLTVSSPWWLVRSLLDREFRRMVAERLLGAGLPAPVPGRQRVLIHGVSVGEVKVAVPLVRALAEALPGVEVLICSTTGTGLSVARRSFPELSIVRFPLDLSWVVRRFLRRLRPACVVLVELEIWPNFLRCCNRLDIPVAVINGRITPSSFGHYRVFRDLLPQFNRISLFCAQEPGYAERFRELSRAPERVVVTGNMKADSLRVGPPEVPDELRRLVGARGGQGVIVAGSTHAPEEELVTRAWLAGAPAARLVLVPRHPERAGDVVRALAALGPAPQLWTRLRGGETSDPARPLIVDTIGELESIYALADLVFVGGSLVPHGGQNMLEPASQGRAVVYGPHVDNFAREAALLEEAGASARVPDAAGLEHALRRLMADPGERSRMAEAGRRAVAASQGATERTLRALEACVLRPERASAGVPRPR